MEKTRILLVEDEPDLAQVLADYLVRDGYEASVEGNGARALERIRREPPDLLLLDLMLPGKDGLDVCRELRAHSDVPVSVLTARGEEADRVMGLDLGADDYLSKPFSPRELLARIRALVRRARGKVGPPIQTLQVGVLILDPGSRRATVRGQEIPLTGYEFSLLYALASRAGRVLSREQLIELAGGSAEEAFDRSVDVHVSRLRQKLGDDSKNPRMLKTVRGAGYLLAAEPE